MNPRITICLLLAVSAAAVQADDALRARNDAIIVRAIQRMENFDYSQDPRAEAAIERHIARSEGTAEYLELLKRFRADQMGDKLADLLLDDVNDSVKVEAAALLGETPNGPQRLRQMLKSEPMTAAASIARILGLVGNKRAMNMLSDTVSDAERPFEVRSNAAAGLAANKDGQQVLLTLADRKQLAADLRLLVGGLLARSDDESVRRRAAELLPQPQQKDQKPLAPIDKLATMKGNAEHGKELFRTVATCSNCHIVKQFGKEVGPDLSEIGSKLSREAMFTSILDPSAGISHNYENYIVLTASGQVINGLKVSETADEVVIRTADAIDRKIPQAEIEELKKSEKSIMPDNLHHTIDQQGLIDVVEYMSTLVKQGT